MSTAAIVKQPFPAFSNAEKRDHVKATDPPQIFLETNKMADSMNELNQTSDRSADNQDDLQQIKGIGPSIAQALNNTGIYRYADMINFTPKGLADRLKAEIPSISPQRIEHDKWIDQARALTLEQEDQNHPQLKASESEASSADNEATNNSLAPDGAKLQSKTGQISSPSSTTGGSKDKLPRESWRELADYFVSFGYVIGSDGKERLQTTVHHSQLNKDEKWDGVATEQLVTWMLNQANLRRLVETAGQGKEDDSAESSPRDSTDDDTAYLELSQLWVTEAKMPKLVGARQSGTLLQAESRLNLSGPTASRLTNDQIPFSVELFLIDTQSNMSMRIATHSSQLSPGQLTYEIKENFSAPTSVGLYQLYVVARLWPPGKAVTYVQGPVIRVEP